MEVGAERARLMTDGADSVRREIRVNGRRLGTVSGFGCLEAVVSDEGSKSDLFRIVQAAAALTGLNPFWGDYNIFLKSKVNLMCSLVVTISLYACE